MGFRAKKVYGKSKEESCPFCGKIATAKNEQGVAVCRFHIKQELQEIKCLCGSWLEQRQGKFGPYFNCAKCGNLSYAKVMSFKDQTTKRPEAKQEYKRTMQSKPRFSVKKEITITTDDLEYFS